RLTSFQRDTAQALEARTATEQAITALQEAGTLSETDAAKLEKLQGRLQELLASEQNAEQILAIHQWTFDVVNGYNEAWIENGQQDESLIDEVNDILLGLW